MAFNHFVAKITVPTVTSKCPAICEFIVNIPHMRCKPCFHQL